VFARTAIKITKATTVTNEIIITFEITFVINKHASVRQFPHNHNLMGLIYRSIIEFVISEATLSAETDGPIQTVQKTPLITGPRWMGLCF
jgi:hypothetical protein